MATTQTERSYRERVARVVAAIVADPLAEHGLEQLAGIAHFSPFHFHRIYRGITGETVMTTIRRARLAKAAQLLGSGKDSVTQIGMEVGYDSPQAFSRAFQQFTGLAPRDFQKKIGIVTMQDKTDQELSLNVQIVERPAYQVQALRHRGPPSTIPHTFLRMAAHIGERTTDTWFGVMIGDHEDDEDNIEGCLYHAAVSGLGDTQVHPDMQLMTIPGGRYALHTLVGPYTQINAVLTALYSTWLPQSGYVPDDRPTLERYLNSPHDTAPENLLTELLIPIRKFTE